MSFSTSSHGTRRSATHASGEAGPGTPEESFGSFLAGSPAQAVRPTCVPDVHSLVPRVHHPTAENSVKWIEVSPAAAVTDRVTAGLGSVWASSAPGSVPLQARMLAWAARDRRAPPQHRPSSCRSCRPCPGVKAPDSHSAPAASTSAAGREGTQSRSYEDVAPAAPPDATLTAK